MPTVPLSPQAAQAMLSTERPPDEFLLMAAATMHEMGRLIEPEPEPTPPPPLGVD